MPTKLSQWIYKARWFLLVLLLIGSYLLIGGRPLLGFSADYRAYLSNDNPQLKALEKLQSTYDKSDNLMLVIEPDKGDVFNEEALQYISDLTQSSWQIPYSVRVESITNFQHLTASGDEISVRDLYSNSSSDSLSISEIKQVSLNEPQLVNRLVSKSGHVAAINVIYHLPGLSPYENYEIVTFARDLKNTFERQHPGFKVHLTGMAMYNFAFYESAIFDETKLTPLVYAVICIATMLLFRSILATLCVVVVVYLSVYCTEGAAGWLGMSLTSLSSSAPLIVLMIGTADAVHILMAFLKRIRNGLQKKEAIIQSLSDTFVPVTLTTVATAVAFLSLNFSEIPPFRDLGNFVTLGIGFAWLFSMLLLPALCSCLPFNVNEKGDYIEAVMTKLGLLVGRRSVRWLLICAPLVLILVVLAPFNEMNDRYLKWFSEDLEFRKANDFTQENLTGLYTIEYSLKSNLPSGISSSDYLKEVASFTKWLRNQTEIVHVASISDTIKRINSSLHGGNFDHYIIPDTDNLVAQSLLLYEQSLPYGLDLNNQIDIDKSSTRLVISLKELSTSEMLEVEQRTLAWLNHNTQTISADAASITLIFAHIGQRNIESMLLGILTTAVVVSLILVVAFRSLKYGAIALIPNVIPAVMAIGVWFIFSGQIGFSLAIVAAMTFGIVVDNTIHILYAYIKRIKTEGCTHEDAVVYSFKTAGPAMAITSIALITGFLVLGTSSFALNRDMGLATALTLFFALLADFFMLPGIIKQIKDDENEKPITIFDNGRSNTSY